MPRVEFLPQIPLKNTPFFATMGPSSMVKKIGIPRVRYSGLSDWTYPTPNYLLLYQRVSLMIIGRYGIAPAQGSPVEISWVVSIVEPNTIQDEVAK